MLHTESTPLIKTNNSKTKSTTICVICLTITTAILIVFFYHANNSPMATDKLDITLQSDINGPAKTQTRYPRYPPESKLNKHRKMTRIIEYKLEDLPHGIHATEFDSAQIQKFHSELIDQYGYEPTQHHIIFSVSDASTSEYEYEYESDVKKDREPRSKQPPKDELTCSTKSTSGTAEGGFMEINCDGNEVITGCASISANAGGRRWGESASETSQCYTYAEDTSSILSARCCKVENKKIASVALETTCSTSDTSNSDFCIETQCADGMIAVGCTATDHHAKETTFSGTRWLKVSTSVSGCRAQRRDLGYLWSNSYCAMLVGSDNNLVCKPSNGGPAIAHNGAYESKASCSGKGDVLTDCNAHISPEIDYCTAKKAYANDWGILYGGYIAYTNQDTNQQNPTCFAVGTTDAVIAQAICCKIQ